MLYFVIKCFFIEIFTKVWVRVLTFIHYTPDMLH